MRGERTFSAAVAILLSLGALLLLVWVVRGLRVRPTQLDPQTRSEFERIIEASDSYSLVYHEQQHASLAPSAELRTKVSKILLDMVNYGTVGAATRYNADSDELIISAENRGSLRIRRSGRYLAINDRLFEIRQTDPIDLVIERVSHEIYFFESGERKAEGLHDQRKKDGRWTFYYKTGAKRSEGDFDHDRKIGKWIEWSEDGKVANEIDYDKPLPERK